MSYITYDYYVALYGSESLTSEQFNVVSWDAFRKLDMHTTGIDGVRKLKVAFPVDEYDAETVKRCCAKLVHIATQIAAAENSVNNSRGYTETANGLQGKVVSSISAGNESISFSTGGSGATIIDKALSDEAVQKKLYSDTIREYLSGVKDANGVNLLYMGCYPFVVRGNSHV